ncbi:MAG: peptidyl-prolyl cis-trans isomerase [Thermoleophilia bacterium]|nr:peptidyl-prolyl cis-trans isomerase [Thermoleophilia bacterium]
MSGARKFGLVLFGAIFVVVFAGIAIANGGVTQPSVPSGDVALVEDVPGDVGDISQDDYDRTFTQTWKRGGLKAAPKPGDDQYEQVKEAALNDLLDQAWLTGEADELGVTATDREVDNEFATIRKDQFADDAAYQKFLKDSGFTEEEVLARVKLQVLSRKIEDSITKSVKTVPEDQLQDYYDAQKDTFAKPETRDIKLIITDSQADADTVQAALDKDDSDKNFAALAKKYSVHGSKSQGGTTVATEDAFPDPAGSEIMSADLDTLEGPIKNSPKEIYFFKVTKVTPKEEKSFEDVKGQIEQQLLPGAQQQAMSDFVAEYNDKWTSRTFCAQEYLINRCHNFESDGAIEGADPACYADDAGDPKKPLSCPAPVKLNAPMTPGGTADPAAAAAAAGQAAATTGKPQGPVPPGSADDAAAAAAAAAAAGATGAVPAGAAGAAGAAGDPAAAAAAAQAQAAAAAAAGAPPE